MADVSACQGPWDSIAAQSYARRGLRDLRVSTNRAHGIALDMEFASMENVDVTTIILAQIAQFPRSAMGHAMMSACPTLPGRSASSAKDSA